MSEPKPEVPERLVIWEVGDIGGQPGILLRGSVAAVKAAGKLYGEDVCVAPAASRDAAVREALEKAANVGRALDGQGLRLHCGEMTAQEERTARAVVDFMESRIRALREAEKP